MDYNCCNECGSPAHSTVECLHRCHTVPRWQSTRREVFQDVMVLRQQMMQRVQMVQIDRRAPLRVRLKNEDSAVALRVRRKSEEESAAALCVLGL